MAGTQECCSFNRGLIVPTLGIRVFLQGGSVGRINPTPHGCLTYAPTWAAIGAPRFPRLVFKAFPPTCGTCCNFFAFNLRFWETLLFDIWTFFSSFLASIMFPCFHLFFVGSSWEFRYEGVWLHAERFCFWTLMSSRPVWEWIPP